MVASRQMKRTKTPPKMRLRKGEAPSCRSPRCSSDSLARRWGRGLPLITLRAAVYRCPCAGERGPGPAPRPAVPAFPRGLGAAGLADRCRGGGGRRGPVLRVDHPADAEGILDHAEGRREEGPAERHADV